MCYAWDWCGYANPNCSSTDADDGYDSDPYECICSGCSEGDSDDEYQSSLNRLIAVQKWPRAPPPGSPEYSDSEATDTDTDDSAIRCLRIAFSVYADTLEVARPIGDFDVVD